MASGFFGNSLRFWLRPYLSWCTMMESNAQGAFQRLFTIGFPNPSAWQLVPIKENPVVTDVTATREGGKNGTKTSAFAGWGWTLTNVS